MTWKKGDPAPVRETDPGFSRYWGLIQGWAHWAGLVRTLPENRKQNARVQRDKFGEQLGYETGYDYA